MSDSPPTRADIVRLESQIDRLFEISNQTSLAVARIEERMKTQRQCEAPGLCLELRLRLEKLEANALTAAGRREGVTMAGKLLWAFIGSGGLAVLFAAYQLLQNAKP